MNGVQGFIHDQLGDGIPQARTHEIMGETVLFSLLTPMLIELGRGLR